MRQALTVS